MMIRHLFTIVFPALLLISCIKEPDPVIINKDGTYLSGKGAFVVNEGNFRSGNGSLSFFSYDSAKIYNNIFSETNNRPLGDIPYSINILGDKAYIVVNNSDKIEVVNLSNMKSVATINGIKSPRYISFIGNAKAYVTSLFSDSLAVINLLENSISGYINIKRSSESIVEYYSNVYVANWMGGNKIIVINGVSNTVMDSVSVGKEPESMVIDKNETLWVLCNGGYLRDVPAELIAINPLTLAIERRFTFPSVSDSPTCLMIDREGENLFFINGGIRMMNIDDQELPSESFIPESGHNFYRIGINPDNNEIFATDVADYKQNGRLLRYSRIGSLLSELEADVIPGQIFFKLTTDKGIQ